MKQAVVPAVSMTGVHPWVQPHHCLARHFLIAGGRKPPKSIVDLSAGIVSTRHTVLEIGTNQFNYEPKYSSEHARWID